MEAKRRRGEVYWLVLPFFFLLVGWTRMGGRVL